MSFLKSTTFRTVFLTLFVLSALLVIFYSAAGAMQVLLKQHALGTAGLEKSLAWLVQNPTPELEPYHTLHFLRLIFVAPQETWLLLFAVFFSLASLLFWGWGLYKSFYAHAVYQRQISLDETLRQTQNKWRQSDLLTQELQGQVQTIHERMSDCFLLLSTKADVLHANKQARRFFEDKLDLRQELIGTNLGVCVPSYSETEFGRAFEMASQKQKPVQLEAEFGRKIWVEARLYPSAQGVLMYFNDITNKKNFAGQVHLSQRLLKQVLDTAQSPIAITNTEWTYLAANRQWLQKFKMRADKLIGAYHSQVLPGTLGNLQELSELVQDARTYKSAEQPFVIAGTEEWLIWEINPWFDDDNQHAGFLLQAIFTTQQRQQRQQAQRHRERERQLAYYDALTGLPNRQLFYDQLNQILNQAYRNKNLVGLMFIDLDGFKLVNDRMGHDAGDSLLQEIARRLQETTGEEDVVCRLGGDEFTIILTNLKDVTHTAEIANKILTAIDAPVILPQGQAHVTGSIGISLYPSHASTAVDLIKAGDTAMYTAKNAGKNKFQLYEKEQKTIFSKQESISQTLHKALLDGELELYYQPIVATQKGEILGFEALIRWRHPQHGLLDPMTFLPEAEETGKIIDFGRWGIEEACRQNMQWRKAGLGDFIITVNLSAYQFRDASLLNIIDEALAKTALPPTALGVEISERLLSDYPQTTLETVSALKLKGIHLVIDDFGLHQASVTNLRDFPVDFIKINQNFTHSLGDNARNKALVKSMVALAAELGIKVIGEGVETAQQAQFLTQHGCDYLQGYMISRPIKATGAQSFLESGYVFNMEVTTNENPARES